MGKKRTTKSIIISYAVCGIIIFAVNFLFAAIGSLFLVSDYSMTLKVIATIIVLAVPLFVSSLKGLSLAQSDFKYAKSQMGKEQLSKFMQIKINYLSPVYSLCSYLAIMVVVLLIGVIAKTGVFALISFFLFSSIRWGALGETYSELNTFASFFIYFIYVAAVCGAFIVCYVLKIASLKRVQREIASELRSFNN